MTTAIANRIKSVHADKSQGQRLRVVPILGPSHRQPPYELLRQETLKSVQVTEISQEGSVPELKVENLLDVRVYLMDGQELVGAKQNRILNTDVLVPAKSSVSIPVSCVEHGRWRPVSANFSPGKSASHRTRSAKHHRVHESLKQFNRHDADQRAVWDEVAESLIASSTTSATGALSDAYAHRDKDLVAFRSGLRLPREAVGLAVFQDGRLQGIDIFDRHTTLQYFWESLVDSYAIDLLSAPVDPSETQTTDEGQLIRSVMDRGINGRWERFKSPGEGDDWRLEDEQYTASALVWDEKILVHMQVFPKATQGSEGVVAPFRPRIRRPYRP